MISEKHVILRVAKGGIPRVALWRSRVATAGPNVEMPIWMTGELPERGNEAGGSMMFRKTRASTNTVQEATATIVEYNPHKQPENAYPSKIVSPPFSGHCCSASADQVGDVHEQGGWLFMYHRCAVCGFTVRRIVGRAVPGQAMVDGKGRIGKPSPPIHRKRKVRASGRSRRGR